MTEPEAIVARMSEIAPRRPALAELRAAGVEVRLSRGRLQWRSSGPLPRHCAAILRERRNELIADLAEHAERTRRRESRRAAVLELMDQSPGRIVYRTFDDGHPDGVTVAIGIPDVGTAELTIPRDRYDPAALLALFETTHGPATEPEPGTDGGYSLGTAETL